MIAARDIVAGVAVCLTGIACGAAASQPLPSMPEVPQQPSTDEEIVVLGESIESAQGAADRSGTPSEHAHEEDYRCAC